MSGSAKPSDLHVPVHPVRFVTAAALFDGHDAAINIMRRILQAQGAEVIHLGPRPVGATRWSDAVLEEDAQGVAVSSYQGGHVEYFEYLVELLREAGAGHVRVFGGGGGVIVPAEIDAPGDGRGADLLARGRPAARPARHDQRADPATATSTWPPSRPPLEAVLAGDRRALARAITCLQAGPPARRRPGRAGRGGARPGPVPVLGITGTGGSGKSSLTDELVRRFRIDQQDKLRVAVLAVDPTRRRGGGALLGDRIRMNALDGEHVFFRSLATRGAPRAAGPHRRPSSPPARRPGYDLVIVETPGHRAGRRGHRRRSPTCRCT